MYMYRYMYSEELLIYIDMKTFLCTFAFPPQPVGAWLDGNLVTVE